LVAMPDALAHASQAEQPSRRQAADGDNQFRPDQQELPLSPEGAELLLARRRRPVASSRRGLSRIAACDRGAVERCVELVLLELEPAAQSPARAAAPGAALFAFDDAGRLAEHVCVLP